MDMQDLIVQNYPGWTLNEVRNLSMRERINWLDRATARIRR
jgi:hypothetical protein